METRIEALRKTIANRLEQRGHGREFGDDESLFDSGVLDSMAAVNLLLELESEFGIDLNGAGFDFMMIDTFAQIRALIEDTLAEA